MKDNINISYISTSVGALCGMYYGVTRHKPIWGTALITLGFALVGCFIGTKVETFINK